jgi:hypothetical protein
LISQLLANDFRNLEPLDWWPGRGSHLLLGGNGAGKIDSEEEFRSQESECDTALSTTHL